MGRAFAVLLFVALPAAATTYYVASNGSDSNPGTLASPWNSIGKAARTMTAGDTAYIRSGTYSEAVEPLNSGASGAYITYAAYPGETPTVDGTNVELGPDSGLINIALKSFIRVEGLRVIRSGPNNTDAGIYVDRSTDIVIANNFTYDTRSSGIGVWGSRNVTVSGNDVRLACNHQGWEECITVAQTSNFEVMNNIVHEGSLDPVGGEGICIKDGSSNGTVHDNEIQGLTHDPAIYIDAWDKHTFDIQVFCNRVHDTQMGGIDVASEMGGILDNVIVTNNLVYGCGNTGIAVGGWGGPVPTHPVHNIKIINNTVCDSGAVTWGGGISMEDPDARNIAIRNNIASQNFAFQIVVEFPIPGLAIDHNLIDGFRGAEGETLGTDAQQGDPLFVNAVADDFRIMPGSPAIDHGSSVDAPADDFAGIARPQGAAIDIGAHECVFMPMRRRAVGAWLSWNSKIDTFAILSRADDEGSQRRHRFILRSLAG